MNACAIVGAMATFKRAWDQFDRNESSAGW